jgi:hypothetical protein
MRERPGADGAGRRPRGFAAITRRVALRASFKATLWVAALMLLAPATALTGCGSTGVSRTRATQNDLAGLRTDLTRLVKDFDETLWALDAVVDPGARGLRAAYDTYLVRLGRLEDQASSVRSSADSFRASSDTYVANWAGETAKMRNAEIRRRSEERRRRAEVEIARVRTHLETVHARFDAARADFRDIVVALDNDLTPDGVAALAPVIAESRDAAAVAKSEIQGLILELDGLAESLSSGPAPVE